MKTKKSFYKILTTLTILLPTPIYLFIMATIYNIQEDYAIKAQFETVEVFEEEDVYFITTSDKDATIDGVVQFHEKYGYGIYITSEDIIKINKDYYSYIINNKTETRQLTDIKKFEIQKQEKYNIPVIFFVSLAGIGIGASIIFSKMQLVKQYPRAAALITLTTVTLFLFIISTILNNLVGVFVVMTASWGAYCVEYLAIQGKIDKEKSDKKESDLLRTLRELAK